MADAVDLVLAQWSAQRPDVDTSPMAVLARVTRLARLLEREQREFAGRFDLEPGEFDVLATLRRAGSANGMTAGAITNRIDRMEAKDLVRRVADANDRRVVRIRLTDRGRRLVDGMLAEHMELYSRLLEPLDDDTKAVVADALRSLLEKCE
jgi:DNA-binding MarR family transcriptional regulator